MFGNVIGKFLYDLIARNANAWDSTKSPFISSSSIGFNAIEAFKFCLIFSTKILFFLPPPHKRTVSIERFKFEMRSDNSVPKRLAVNSVKVKAPSSNVRPLAKEMSKSLIS